MLYSIPPPTQWLLSPSTHTYVFKTYLNNFHRCICCSPIVNLSTPLATLPIGTSSREGGWVEVVSRGRRRGAQRWCRCSPLRLLHACHMTVWQAAMTRGVVFLSGHSTWVFQQDRLFSDGFVFTARLIELCSRGGPNIFAQVSFWVFLTSLVCAALFHNSSIPDTSQYTLNFRFRLLLVIWTEAQITHASLNVSSDYGQGIIYLVWKELPQFENTPILHHSILIM